MAACAVENLTLDYAFEPRLERPQAFVELAKLPGKQPLIVLPFSSALDKDLSVISWGEYARINVNYMNWSLALNRPLVNGYSGQRSKIMLEFPAKTRGFPDERSLKALRSIVGLRYIIYLPGYNPALDQALFDSRLSNNPDLTLVFRGTDGSYLLSYNPEFAIDDSTYLLAPPRAAQVYLELRCARLSSSPGIHVSIAGQDANLGTELINEQFLVSTDGSWQHFGIRLPELSEKVRPIRLIFRDVSNKDLFIRNVSLK